MLYSIHLLDDNGKGTYLSIKGKSEWKTKNNCNKAFERYSKSY